MLPIVVYLGSVGLIHIFNELTLNKAKIFHNFVCMISGLLNTYFYIFNESPIESPRPVCPPKTWPSSGRPTSWGLLFSSHTRRSISAQRKVQFWCKVQITFLPRRTQKWNIQGCNSIWSRTPRSSSIWLRMLPRFSRLTPTVQCTLSNLPNLFNLSTVINLSRYKDWAKGIPRSDFLWMATNFVFLYHR